MLSNVDISMFQILIFSFLIYVSYSSFRLVKKFLNNHEESKLIENFDLYDKILTIYKDKAFEVIHKDRILIYSIEATKPNNAEIESAAKDYAKLVLKLIGPAVKERLIDIYGNEETLLINLVEDFRVRFEEDNIREHALRNVMSSEVEVQDDKSSIERSLPKIT